MSILKFAKQVIVTILLVFSYKTLAFASIEETLKLKDADFTMGSKDAPVVIIEYASLTCPHCADFFQVTLPKLKKDFIEKNQVLYVYRDFPHNAPALFAAATARCLNRDKFFPFIKLLFERQSAWAFQKNYLEVLENIAKFAGLSGEQFQQCVNNRDNQNIVLSEVKEIREELKINAVPVFFINGELFNHAMDYEKLSAHINKLILEKK